MRILHLFADWKWTGPAEPTVDLCQALQERGESVVLAYSRPPSGSEDSLETRIRHRRIPRETSFHLRPLAKLHQISRFVEIVGDVAALARYVDSEAFDLVNVHHSHDHIVGALAARWCQSRPVIIRTDHARDSLAAGWPHRWFYRQFTDGIVTFSRRARQRLIARVGFRPEQVAEVTPAVNLSRFDPDRTYRDMRQVFGLSPATPVVGIVARFQKYRRTDVLLKAMGRVVREVPEARLVLVGRSSQMKESVLIPMERLGISSHVVLAGYRRDDYIDTLACFDVFVLLTPGSDGTARAVREAMAMGKTVVVANKGILPELVDNGVTGLVVDETPEALARALVTVINNVEVRTRLARAARAKAQETFRVERQATQVVEFYEQMLRLKRQAA